jgi:hypothetical protein
MKEKGQPDEARGYWKRALEVKPELGDGYYDRAAR